MHDWDIAFARNYKVNAEGNKMKKKYVLVVLLLAALAGIIVFFAGNGQKVRCETGIKNQDYYYILEFEKMNRDDSCRIPACKGDVFSVRCRIDKGNVDLIIGMDGRTPVYRGNDIESGAFEVIASEEGEYRISVNAKHADGYVEVYVKNGTAENDTIEDAEETNQSGMEDSEPHPGPDTAELVNLRGDETDVYKLVDGTYMDHIARRYIYNGTDTWTDEDGVEWNEKVR